jgi:hypothetical protein
MLVMVVKRELLSIFGVCISVAGVVGIIFSSVMSWLFLSVIATLSGLFTLSIRNQSL